MTTTRRRILVGAAAMPVLAMPVFTADDPVHAAISRHKLIEDVYIAACNVGHEATGKLCWQADAALLDLVRMTPVTVGGAAALLRHIEQHNDTYGNAPFGDCNGDLHTAGRTLLGRIASGLDNALVRWPLTIGGMQ